MKQYHDLCKHILENGKVREDRTGTGTIGVFGYQMRFDLSKGFPLLTTKDLGGIRFDGIVEELLWFLRGETNIKPLVDKGINIWNRDAYRVYKKHHGHLTYKEFVQKIKTDEAFASLWGDLGRVYGAQWRSWGEVYNGGEDYRVHDQITNVINSLRNDPYSRRHIVSAWNVADLDKMALPPCHVLFQFYVEGDGKLSCQLYQRSADVFLGVPYNIASYALLTTIIAREVGLQVGEFIHTLGDAHIYLNHVDNVKLQLTREPKPLPKLAISKRMISNIFSYERKDFELIGYDPHPSIKGEQSS